MTAATAQRPKSRLSMSFPYSGWLIIIQQDTNIRYFPRPANPGGFLSGYRRDFLGVRFCFPSGPSASELQVPYSGARLVFGPGVEQTEYRGTRPRHGGVEGSCIVERPFDCGQFGVFAEEGCFKSVRKIVPPCRYRTGEAFRQRFFRNPGSDSRIGFRSRDADGGLDEHHPIPFQVYFRRTHDLAASAAQLRGIVEEKWDVAAEFQGQRLEAPDTGSDGKEGV